MNSMQISISSIRHPSLFAFVQMHRKYSARNRIAILQEIASMGLDLIEQGIDGSKWAKPEEGGYQRIRISFALSGSCAERFSALKKKSKKDGRVFAIEIVDVLDAGAWSYLNQKADDSKEIQGKEDVATASVTHDTEGSPSKGAPEKQISETPLDEKSSSEEEKRDEAEAEDACGFEIHDDDVKSIIGF